MSNGLHLRLAFMKILGQRCLHPQKSDPQVHNVQSCITTTHQPTKATLFSLLLPLSTQAKN